MSVSEEPQHNTDEEGFAIVRRSLRGHLSAYEIAVFVALAWRINPQGMCWVRLSLLAEDAGCSQMTVRRALASLRGKGLVTWEPRHSEDGRVICNTYYVPILQRPTAVVLSEHHPRSEEPAVVPSEQRPPSERTTEREPMNEKTPTGPLSDVAQDARVRVSRTSGELQRAWRPSEQVWSLAATRFPHVDLEYQHTQFMAYYLSKGLRSNDLEAAWLGFMAKKERDEEARIKAESEGPDEFGNMPWQHKPAEHVTKPGEPTDEELHALALAAARESRRKGGK